MDLRLGLVFQHLVQCFQPKIQDFHIWALWSHQLSSFHGSDTKIEIEILWQQINVSIIVSMDFVMWCSGEMAKSDKVGLSTSSIFALNNMKIGVQFLLLTLIDNCEVIYFLKWCPIFDSLPLCQFKKYNNSLWGHP